MSSGTARGKCLEVCACMCACVKIAAELYPQAYTDRSRWTAGCGVLENVSPPGR